MQEHGNQGACHQGIGPLEDPLDEEAEWIYIHIRQHHCHHLVGKVF